MNIKNMEGIMQIVRYVILSAILIVSHCLPDILLFGSIAHAQTAGAVTKLYGHDLLNEYAVSTTRETAGKIQVFVLGEVLNPGTYSTDSRITLAGAVSLAGGPAGRGSLRNVQLIRDGEKVIRIDLYDLFFESDRYQHEALRSGDVIVVPSSDTIVSIAGNVKRPAVYELKGRYDLKGLFDMAGGITQGDYTQKIHVERRQNNKIMTVMDFDDKHPDKADGFVLKDGDSVKVFSEVDGKEQAVLPVGRVKHPDKYEYKSGMRAVQAIIDSANDLPDGVSLKSHDDKVIKHGKKRRAEKYVTISGEVNSPGKYLIQKGERLSKLIERAGNYTDKACLRGAVFISEEIRGKQQKKLEDMIEGLKGKLMDGSENMELNRARMFIESLQKLKASGRIPVKLMHLRLLKGSEYDIVLDNGDSIFIPIEKSYINVTGAVLSQGSFVYSRESDYKDYIAEAGGYMKYADENNVFVRKADGIMRKLSRGFITWNLREEQWEVTAFSKETDEIGPGDTIIVHEKTDHIQWLRKDKGITRILQQIFALTGNAETAF